MSFFVAVFFGESGQACDHESSLSLELRNSGLERSPGTTSN